VSRRQVRGRPRHPGAGLWRHRAAPPVRGRDRVVTIALALAGLVAVARLFDWWFRPAHVNQAVLFAGLSLAVWYGIARLLAGWINGLAIARAPHQPPPANLSVAIFTTSSPGEPIEMFERTLAACARVRYPHRTYLLDDTRDPRVGELAARHGAIRVELLDLPGAKAGKINRALELTREDFVLVLDPDHLPFPEFLDRVLGHFADERVGFVQVAQAYYNQGRSFTAAAAAEQTYAFYGPGLMGLYGHGASVAIGANCTFRRRALEAIGGHGVGLAEDLVTAIRLHAAGWRSVYLPEVVSRGLVPEDLGSYYTQQLKWSRGVYEVLFAELPRAFRRLTWRQRLAYAAIGTYYLCGATTLLFLVFPYLYLWLGLQPADMYFEDFVSAGGPVAAIGIVTYLYAQRWLCDPDRERGLHWRGMLLKLGTWPVYLAGTVLGVLRRDVPYRPTPKQAVAGRFLRLAWPHLLLVAALGATVVRVVATRLLGGPDARLGLSAEAVWAMLGFATLPAAASVASLVAAWQSRHAPAAPPWHGIDVNDLGGAA